MVILLLFCGGAGLRRLLPELLHPFVVEFVIEVVLVQFKLVALRRLAKVQLSSLEHLGKVVTDFPPLGGKLFLFWSESGLLFHLLQGAAVVHTLVDVPAREALGAFHILNGAGTLADTGSLVGNAGATVEAGIQHEVLHLDVETVAMHLVCNGCTNRSATGHLGTFSKSFFPQGSVLLEFGGSSRLVAIAIAFGLLGGRIIRSVGTAAADEKEKGKGNEQFFHANNINKKIFSGAFFNKKWENGEFSQISPFLP